MTHFVLARADLESGTDFALPMFLILVLGRHKEQAMTQYLDEIVRIRAGSQQQAEHWRQLLEAEGIAADIVGQYLGGFGLVPPGYPLPELWVSSKDADRARKTVESDQNR